MVNNYSKAYKEVYEILKRVPHEEFEKVSQDLVKTIENNMDKEYFYQYNEELEFEEQNLLRETKAILAIIYRDYWATPEEREKIVAKFNNDIRKEEEKKRKQYDANNLFKNNDIKKIENNNNLPAEVKKENIFQKIIKFIGNLLKLKNK